MFYYTGMSAVYDVPDPDKILFLRFLLTDDARDFYKCITQNKKTWKRSVIYSPSDMHLQQNKQGFPAKFWNSALQTYLETTKMIWTASNKLLCRIRAIALLEKPKHIADEAKVRFLHQLGLARIGGLKLYPGHSQILQARYDQSIWNISQRTERHRIQRNVIQTLHHNPIFRKSLWKTTSQNIVHLLKTFDMGKPDDKFSETFYINHGQFAINPRLTRRHVSKINGVSLHQLSLFIVLIVVKGAFF